jgi:anion-transporting  ArsA/GET3 family ATPase
MATDYIETARENLDLLPSGYRLAEIERLAARGRSQAILLRDALQPSLPHYDMMLIDCPPTSGLLNFNALYAVNEVIIPVSGDYLALHGLSQLMRTLKSAERFMEKKLQLWIVLTRYATRRRLAAQVKEKLVKYFLSQVLATVIRENAPLAECPSFAKSFFEYRCRSNGLRVTRPGPGLGEAGRGFAEVADEVRQLSQNSNQYSEKIGAVVQEAKANIDQAKELAAHMASRDMTETISEKDRVSRMLPAVEQYNQSVETQLARVSDISEEISQAVGVAV